MHPRLTSDLEIRGVSLTEMLVAAVIAAAVFSTAALVFQSITANQKRLATVVSVPLGEEIIENFYGLEDTDTLNVYSAPSYAQAATANRLREQFHDDVKSSIAVFCLGRDGLNTIRGSSFLLPTVNYLLDTPESLKLLLEAQFGSAADVYVTASGASTEEDATIYILGLSLSTSLLSVIATWEIDIVPITDGDDNLEGNYVSVRRYTDDDLTGYYDIYYPASTGNDFSPLFVHMLRTGASGLSTNPDKLKFTAATLSTFYLLWWPDPAARHLEASDPPQPTFTTSDPISDYWQMGGRTSFGFVVPMFPGLL